METTSYYMAASAEEEGEIEDAPLSVSEFVVGVSCLTAIFLFLSIHNQYLPKPDPLIIQLHHLSVSNFTVTDDSKLSAVWEADVTLMNPNSGSNIHVARFQSFVYKEGEVVSCAMAKPINIRPMKRRSMRIRFNVKGWSGCNGDGEEEEGNFNVKEKVVEEMRAEREINGTVRFELGMKMVVQKSFLLDRLRMWQPGMSTTANCSSLSVGFVPGTDHGKLLRNAATTTDTGIRCFIPPQFPD